MRDLGVLCHTRIFAFSTILRKLNVKTWQKSNYKE